MASEEYKESDLSKIVKRLMDEEGFEFGEAVKEAMEQTKNFESKADGGSIGIEVLFTDKMKNGGRVPAVSGGFLKLLAEGASKGKKGIMELVESGKGRFDEFVETMNQSKKPSELIDESIQVTKEMRDGPITIKMLEDMNPDTVKKLLRSEEIGLYGSQRPEALIAADMIKRFTKADGTIDYERAEIILNRKLKGNESLDELLEIEFTTRPDKIPDEGLADGGRVGLFMGGDPLTGQALSIYDSMKSYDFSDQEIANALSAQGLYTAGGSTPETTAPNIIGSQINQGGGGDGIQSIGPQNIASFTETVEARQKRLNKPGKIADFINSNLGKIGINTQRSANEMLASGIKDTRKTSGIPFGISGMIAKALPNAYTDKLTLGEQVFSQENMGFTGQGNMANKDPFGINVVSAFGNYADYVKDRVAELEDIVADQKKRGLTDTYQMKELAFRSKQDIDRQNRISDAAKIQELQRKEKERIAKANTARQVVMEEARQRGDNPSAGSFSSNSPGGISQQTSRDARGGMSGWGLRDGGLATMFTRRR